MNNNFQVKNGISISGIPVFDAVGNLVGPTTNAISSTAIAANTGISNAASASVYANTGINNAASSSAYANTGINNAASASAYANTGINNAASASSYANTGINNAASASSYANTKVNKSGDTITGPIIISNTGSGALQVAGTVTISQDLNVSGNIFLGGSTTTISSNNLTLSDSLIYLADGNIANTADIGIVGNVTNGHYYHTGLVRDHLDGTWKFFSNVTSEPTTTVNFGEANTVYDVIRVGGVVSPTGTVSTANLAYTGTLTGGTGVVAIGTSQIYKDASGNVGIGTSSPSGKLNIAGTEFAGVTFNSPTYPTNGTYIGLDGSGVLDINNRENKAITVSTNNILRMTIDSSGNVGIGTTSINVKLDVLSGVANSPGDSIASAVASFTGPNYNFNTGSNPATFQIQSNSTLGVDVGATIGLGGRYTGTSFAQFAIIKGAKENATDGNYSTYLAFGTRLSGGQITEKMRIDSSGNVGIGTSNPACKLNVYSSTAQNDTYGFVQIENSTAAAGVNASYTAKNYSGTSQFMQWENYGLRIGSRIITNTGAGHVTFTTGNDAERMRITSAGGVSFGSSGTAYGTSGQVLTSAGNAAPTWINQSSIAAGTASNITAYTINQNVGTANAVQFSDITTTRAAALTTGYMYYGNTGTKYAGFDGTNFVSSMPMSFNILGSSASCTGNAATATASQNATFLTQPNATWGAKIQLGGNGAGSGVANIATVQATDGNIHIDSGVGKVMYLNYYQNGAIYFNGGAYNISSNGSQYNGNAATATSATNATTAGGFTPSQTNGTGNRIVVADASGYINNNYFNSTDNAVGSGVTAMMVKAGDNYFRSASAAAVATFINGQTFNIAGGAAYAGLRGTAAIGASGSAVTFSGIPAGVGRIVLVCNTISVTSTIPPLIRIGAATISATGYIGSTWYHSTAGISGAAITAGFDMLNTIAAATVYCGIFILTKYADNHTWLCTGSVGSTAGGVGGGVHGQSPNLGAALTQVSIQMPTTAFDGGAFSIYYE